MRTTLGVVIAAAAMLLGASLANATVGSNVHALSLLSTNSSPAQNVYWRRYHHWHHWNHWGHRHCWWRYGHRHCHW
jgi:hypothetical protein